MLPLQVASIMLFLFTYEKAIWENAETMYELPQLRNNNNERWLSEFLKWAVLKEGKKLISTIKIWVNKVTISGSFLFVIVCSI